MKFGGKTTKNWQRGTMALQSEMGIWRVAPSAGKKRRIYRWNIKTDILLTLDELNWGNKRGRKEKTRENGTVEGRQECEREGT